MFSWGSTSSSIGMQLGTESTPLFFSVIGVDFAMNTVWRPRRDLNPCYRRESGSDSVLARFDWTGQDSAIASNEAGMKRI